MQEPAFHEIQFNSFLLLILHKIQPDHTVGFHHVFQGTHRFCPGPSFKTTIRIDNQLLCWSSAFQEASQLAFHECNSWDNGRMNVVQTRPKSLAVANLVKSQQRGIITTGVFNS